jgi:hypothetical protein
MAARPPPDTRAVADAVHSLHAQLAPALKPRSATPWLVALGVIALMVLLASALTPTTAATGAAPKLVTSDHVFELAFDDTGTGLGGVKPRLTVSPPLEGSAADLVDAAQKQTLFTFGPTDKPLCMRTKTEHVALIADYLTASGLHAHHPRLLRRIATTPRFAPLTDGAPSRQACLWLTAYGLLVATPDIDTQAMHGTKAAHPLALTSAAPSTSKAPHARLPVAFWNMTDGRLTDEDDARWPFGATSASTRVVWRLVHGKPTGARRELQFLANGELRLVELSGRATLTGVLWTASSDVRTSGANMLVHQCTSS